MKYMFDEADFDYLVANCFYLLPAKAIVESIKPIEPLSDEEIRVALSLQNKPPLCVTRDARFIEAHILGEKHDS